MNTEQRVFKEIREAYNEREFAKKAEKERVAKEKAEAEAKRKAKEAEAEKVLKEIKDLLPEKKKRTPISRVTPWGYDYDWVAKKAKENE